ncbi:hypothetical protein M409DRAFT_23968 [Zasmidium cellare ATCC 36951]|uniref:Methyltransferase domain-containing protein n=1 Tax=Zasmidium cellare ATCC 36951 TaxID=1080233 RepID=A0A6A6CHK3_ZASCE|nr:uncharacterized protein M409DRAFT_23968 [Zasmidium cellare ATCC 36951]KAF2165678.1 hypothetical protein M409DRAFT_23968 [Zasmidium cellare ATCC 36951]
MDPMQLYVQSMQQTDHKIREQARLEGQHENVLHAMNGQAIYAPIDLSMPNLRILDAGCANGRWLEDLAKSVAPTQHSYVGIDVSDGAFPDQAPDNFTFVKQSIADPWPASWKGTFDIVHQRFTLAGGAQLGLLPLVQNFADLLSPGGWIQLVEPDTDEIPGNAESATQFIDMIEALLAFSFRQARPFKDLDQVLKDAGLTNVQRRDVMVPWGTTAPTAELAIKGIETPAAVVNEMESAMKGLGIWENQWNGLEARLRKELAEKGGFERINIVCGQKKTEDSL